MSKRSQEKRQTKATRAIRFMRQKSGLSLNSAGRLCGLTGSAIAHIEHGRMDLPPARIEAMVQIYGFTMNQFNALMGEEEVPLNKRDECVSIIRELAESKVAAVYGILVNFSN